MSRNVKRALVNEDLYSEHKKLYLTTTSHPELCGGRGTRTHKSLRTTVFKPAHELPVLFHLVPHDLAQFGKSAAASPIIPTGPF